MKVLQLYFVLILGLGFVSTACWAGSDKKHTFSFGIVPQQSATVLAKKWLPIFRYLNKKTGHKFVFKTNKTIPEFENNLLGKKYDFAYMNPYHYTVFHKKSGYKAILKQGQKQIKGILVAHKNSRIDSLADLNNQTVAFPAPAAFAATVIPKSTMKSQDINVTSQYVSSHESVYKNVAYGNFVAGGGIERTFANTPKEITDNLKVFWRSKGYTPHAIAFTGDIPQSVVDKVINAFLEMNSDEEGEKLLESIKFKSIEAANDSDWDDVRDLNIELLNDLQKVSG